MRSLKTQNQGNASEFRADGLLALRTTSSLIRSKGKVKLLSEKLSARLTNTIEFRTYSLKKRKREREVTTFYFSLQISAKPYLRSRKLHLPLVFPRNFKDPHTASHRYIVANA